MRDWPKPCASVACLSLFLIFSDIVEFTVDKAAQSVWTAGRGVCADGGAWCACGRRGVVCGRRGVRSTKNAPVALVAVLQPCKSYFLL